MDDRQENRGGGVRLAAFGVASVLAVVGLGFGVIGMVNALESQECGPGGYGGYCHPPKVTVDPSTNLVDAQAVTVTARGFQRSKSFGAAQCDASIPSIDGCDLSNVVLTTTDAVGEATFTMQLRRIITVQGRRVDCAVTRCAVGAGTLKGGTPIEATSTLVRFDPSVPPLPELNMRVTVTSATLRGMSGTMSCTRRASASVEGSVSQPAGGGTAYAGGYSRPTDCGPTPKPWSLSFSQRHGQLTTGPASYFVYGYATDEIDDAYAEGSGEISLTAP